MKADILADGLVPALLFASGGLGPLTADYS